MTITPTETKPIIVGPIPDVIELEFSEVDRTTAEPFQNVTNCLFCTALRNRGINVSSAGGDSVNTEYGAYDISRFCHPFHPETTRDTKEFYIHSQRDHDAEYIGIGPFWKSTLVGQKVMLRRIK